jgi:hypothetical protein
VNGTAVDWNDLPQELMDVELKVVVLGGLYIDYSLYSYTLVSLLRQLVP